MELQVISQDGSSFDPATLIVWRQPLGFSGWWLWASPHYLPIYLYRPSHKPHHIHLCLPCFLCATQTFSTAILCESYISSYDGFGCQNKSLVFIILTFCSINLTGVWNYNLERNYSFNYALGLAHSLALSSRAQECRIGLNNLATNFKFLL